MNEATITITLEEYKDLLRKAERVATVERMVENSGYVSVEDVELVLGIKKEKGDE